MKMKMMMLWLRRKIFENYIHNSQVGYFIASLAKALKLSWFKFEFERQRHALIRGDLKMVLSAQTTIFHDSRA